MSIRIVADSTCDLPASLAESLEVPIVPLYVNVGNKGYRDGVDMSREEFYTGLPDFLDHPSTAAPGPALFRQVFDRLRQEGATEIISVHISESLSATVQVARQVAAEIKEIPIHVIDSQQLTLGTGFQVELAARMAKLGKSSLEIIKAMEDMASRTFVAAALDTLEFMKRSGRVSSLVASFGSMLQLKPILTMKDGIPGSQRVRTRHKALDRIRDFLDDYVPIERIGLIHSNAAAKAVEFQESIRPLTNGLEMSIAPQNITPVIGTHVGPGIVGYAVVKQASG